MTGLMSNAKVWSSRAIRSASIEAVRGAPLGNKVDLSTL